MASVTKWDRSRPPSREELLGIYAAEGLDPHLWSNGPGDTYSTHSHDYEKVLYCVDGSITFLIAGSELTLDPGDRLVVERGTPHSAVVGPTGVVCMEAAR